jgi:hypothetical protein
MISLGGFCPVFTVDLVIAMVTSPAALSAALAETLIFSTLAAHREEPELIIMQRVMSYPMCT